VRLGDLLIATGQLTATQVEQASRTQVIWGGRLGSVLVELKLIDLDGLTRALASLHQMPAALSSHFDRVMPELQARLPAEIAGLWLCVPITKLPGDGERVAVAVAGPLTAAAEEEIANHLGVSREQLVIGIAAEMRIRYHLERAYGIARHQRFLRSRAGRRSEPPQALNIAIEELTPDDLQFENSDVYSLEPEFVDAPLAVELPEPSVEIYAAEAIELTSDPKANRRYMSTLADDSREHISVPPIDADRSALGRIAIRKAAVPAASLAAHGAPDEVIDLPATLEAATRAIRRGTDRDRVADLAIAALQVFAGVHTVALFILRGEVAIGWKAKYREQDGSDFAANLVVPIDEPNLITTVTQRGATPLFVERDHVESDIDRRLMNAFASLVQDDQTAHNEANWLMIAPVTIKEHAACVVVAVASEQSADSQSNFSTIIASISTAFVRLIHAARR
jgi:hypothetical protein